MKTIAHTLRIKCPLCGSDQREQIGPIPSSVFVDGNPTINKDRLASSGLLELPDISLVRCTACTFCYTEAQLSAHWESVFWNDVYIPDNSQSKILRAAKRRENIHR